MASEILKLNRDECVLVPDDIRERLAQQYNLAADLASFIGEHLAAHQIREHFDKLCTELLQIRELLNRQTYHVGFLGPFQAGKSTTVNHVLGALNASDEPAGVGQGFPTTAVITRLVRSNSQHSIRPVFLTESEYETKRRFLAELVGLDPEERDEVLIRECKRILRTWQSEVRTRCDRSGNESPVRRRDVEYLVLMLKSYSRFRSYIQPQRVVLEQVPYSERWAYLVHPPDPWEEQEGVVTPLLKEVEIRYCTDVIPHTLELLDLPGYDGECSVDAFITDQFLKVLHGAFVFCRATDFGGIVETIVSKLRHALGNDFLGRVWLVITRCDDVNVKGSDSNEEWNVFEQIKSFAEKKGIPTSQILFVTNDLGAFHSRMQDERFRSALYRALETAAKEWPELVRCWERLNEDGGIGELRDLIARQLAEAVSRSIAEAAGSRLPRLCDYLFRLASQMADEKLLEELPERIAAWRKHLLEKSSIRPSQVRQLAERIREDLDEKWEGKAVSAELLEDVIAQGGNQRLQEEFTIHARMLDTAIHSFLQASWIQLAYEAVVQDFTYLEHQIGRLELHGFCERGVVAYFEKCCWEDQRNLAWLNQHLVSFQANNPFESLPDHASPIYTGEQYLELMMRKIGVVSQQLATALLLRVREHVLTLLESIREFGVSLHRDGQIALPADWREKIEQFRRQLCHVAA